MNCAAVFFVGAPRVCPDSCSDDFLRASSMSFFLPVLLNGGCSQLKLDQQVLHVVWWPLLVALGGGLAADICLALSSDHLACISSNDNLVNSGSCFLSTVSVNSLFKYVASLSARWYDRF